MGAPGVMVEIRRADARIVEGAVDPPEGLDRRIQHRLDLLGFDHFHGKRNCLAAGLADHGGGLLRAFRIEIGRGHPRTLPGAEQRGRAPDAVPAPGNQRRLARQHSRHVFDSPFRYSVPPVRTPCSRRRHCRWPR